MPLPSLKNHSEIPFPEDHALKTIAEIMPNAAAMQLYNLAREASSCVPEVGHSPSWGAILATTVILLAQQCCEIVELWPKSQAWCLEQLRDFDV